MVTTESLDALTMLPVKRVAKVVKRGRIRYGRVVGYADNNSGRIYAVQFGTRQTWELCKNVKFLPKIVIGTSIVPGPPIRVPREKIGLEKLEALL